MVHLNLPPKSLLLFWSGVCGIPVKSIYSRTGSPCCWRPSYVPYMGILGRLRLTLGYLRPEKKIYINKPEGVPPSHGSKRDDDVWVTIWYQRFRHQITTHVSFFLFIDILKIRGCSGDLPPRHIRYFFDPPPSRIRINRRPPPQTY